MYLAQGLHIEGGQFKSGMIEAIATLVVVWISWPIQLLFTSKSVY